MKLAYSDLRYNGDPRFADIPVRGLLSKDYARKRAAAIDPAKANCAVAAGAPGVRRDHLSDDRGQGRQHRQLDPEPVRLFRLRRDGGGHGIPAARSRRRISRWLAGSPNVLAGGKRPSHTIIPGFMEKGDQHIGFGIMGGSNQAMAHAQFVSNVVDYGMNVQQAMESARFRKTGAPGCDVRIEGRVPAAAIQDLKRAGSSGAGRSRVRFGGHRSRAGDPVQLDHQDQVRRVGSAGGWVGGAGTDSVGDVRQRMSPSALATMRDSCACCPHSVLSSFVLLGSACAQTLPVNWRVQPAGTQSGARFAAAERGGFARWQISAGAECGQPAFDQRGRDAAR